MKSQMIVLCGMILAIFIGCGESQESKDLKAQVKDLQTKLDDAKKASVQAPTPTTAASSVAYITSGLPVGTSACVESTASTTIGSAADLRQTGEIVEKLSKINGEIRITSPDGRTVSMLRNAPLPQTLKLETKVEHVGKIEHQGKVDLSGKIEMIGDVKIDGKLVTNATVMLNENIKIDGKVVVAGTVTTNEKVVPVYLDPCTRELRAIR